MKNWTSVERILLGAVLGLLLVNVHAYGWWCDKYGATAVNQCCFTNNVIDPDTGQPYTIRSAADCIACTYTWCVANTFWCRKTCEETAGGICLANNGCPAAPVSIITDFTFTVWLAPGDTALTSVDWAVTDAALGGTTWASGTATGSALGTTYVTTNGLGYGIYTVTVSLGSDVSLSSGTYWLQLQNAAVASGDPVYWDENDGPSQAYQTYTGSIGSEAFSILAHSSVFYTNGAPNGTNNAYLISYGYAVANSFTVP